jgi:hypothetical protein
VTGDSVVNHLSTSPTVIIPNPNLSINSNINMEVHMNRIVDDYIVQFKNDIKTKMIDLDIVRPVEDSNTDDIQRDKMRELMEYVFEYPKLVLTKKDLIISKKKTPITMDMKRDSENDGLPFPTEMQCTAKRSDGIQCTRKKKKGCEFCGTHAKLEATQKLASSTESGQKMEVSAEDIHGIIYYIDKFNNVYHTEDILEGKENPRIIAKAIKHNENTYTINMISI